MNNPGVEVAVRAGKRRTPWKAPVGANCAEKELSEGAIGPNRKMLSSTNDAS